MLVSDTRKSVSYLSSAPAKYPPPPFTRFEDMQMLHHTKTLGVIQVDESVWKKLTREEKREIERICDEKLEDYYRRFSNAEKGK